MSLFEILVKKTRTVDWPTGRHPKDILGFIAAIVAFFYVHPVLGWLMAGFWLVVMSIEFLDKYRGPRAANGVLRLATLGSHENVNLLFSHRHRVIFLQVRPFSADHPQPQELGIHPPRILAALSSVERERLRALNLSVTLHPSGVLAPANVNGTDFATLLNIAQSVRDVPKRLIENAMSDDISAAVWALVHLQADDFTPPVVHPPWVAIARAALSDSGLKVALDAVGPVQSALALRGVLASGVLKRSTLDALAASLESESLHTEAGCLKRWSWLRAMKRDTTQAFEALLPVVGPLTIRALNPLTVFLTYDEKAALKQALDVSGGHLSLETESDGGLSVADKDQNPKDK